MVNTLSIVPPPSMVIINSPSIGPIYESTNFNLTCTGTLPNVVDTTVLVTVVWFDPQNKVIPVESRCMITNVTSNGNDEFESTLVFLPIDNIDHNSNFNDTGTYISQIVLAFIISLSDIATIRSSIGTSICHLMEKNVTRRSSWFLRVYYSISCCQ